MDPCFAIIDRNTLSYMALRHVLQDMFRHIDVFPYNSIEEFIRDSNRHFVHFFVSSEIFFSHADEFETLKDRTTILSAGPAANIRMAGWRVMDVSVPEDKLLKQLEHLPDTGRYTKEHIDRIATENCIQRLSNREKDVLRLIVKGHINKEIADELGISLATAIFHRNNICDKLHTRSVGKLTVMAVLSGLVELNEI